MNNVNVEGMKRFAEAVKNNPAEAKKVKRVTSIWNFEEGKPQVRAVLEHSGGNVAVQSELPAFAGGWGTSPDPIQFCMFGLGACFAVTFAATAAQEGVRLTKLEVTAENFMDLRKQLGLSKDNIIEKVRLTVRAAGAPLETLERLVRLTEERCPGTEAIVRSLPLDVTLET